MKIRSIFSNSAGILLSRIFGFIRDLMMASILGANIYSDIFFVAFKLPNLFRRIFGEGAFAQSFIPAFIASRHKSIFSVKILIIFTSIIVLLSIGVSIFSYPVTKLIAPGFDSSVVLESAHFVAIQFWYLPLIFLVTFLASLLQYKEHFATTAFATVLLNIAIIGGLLYSKGETPQKIIEILSWSVIIGGILQLIAHLIAIKKFKLFRLLKTGFLSVIKYGDKVSNESKRFFSNFFPAMWGNSTAQVMAFLDTWLASFLVSGSISYLYYANRIFQLPLALFAIALSTAIFPSIAKLINKKDEEGAIKELKRGFWILLFLLSLATAGGIIFSKEIIWLLFERGAFHRSDTIETANVLQTYMIALLPFGLGKLFSLWLYSRHEQMKAAKIATISLGAYAITAFSLFQILGVVGLAFATTVSGFVNFIFLIRSFGFEKFLQLYEKRKGTIFIITLSISILLMLSIHIFFVKYLSLP